MCGQLVLVAQAPVRLAGGCFLHASSCLHLSCITLAHLLATANNWSISTDTLMSYIWYAKGLQWSIKYLILLFFIGLVRFLFCTDISQLYYYYVGLHSVYNVLEPSCSSVFCTKHDYDSYRRDCSQIGYQKPVNNVFSLVSIIKQ